MASNLSSIGFLFASDDEFVDTMTRLAAAAGETIAVAAGEYAIWRCRSGAAIWFQLARGDDATLEIVGLTPVFEGKSEVALRITDRIVRPDDTAFEGCFKAWTVADGNDEYPRLLEAADFALHAQRSPPFRAVAQVSALARELTAYSGEQAFLAAQPGDELKMAAQAFVPTGLFPTQGGEPASPAAEAWFTGRIAEHRLLVNGATGHPYHWLLVESLAASYDVLADPSIVRGEIVEGGTVEVVCGMFCRLIG